MQPLAGKPAIESRNSEQCAGFGEDSGGAQDAKCAQRRFNAGGCDGIGPLFFLYAVRNTVNVVNIVSVNVFILQI